MTEVYVDPLWYAQTDDATRFVLVIYDFNIQYDLNIHYDLAVPTVDDKASF